MYGSKKSFLSPCKVILEYEGGKHTFSQISEQMDFEDVSVRLSLPVPGDERQLAISITADTTPVTALRLRWKIQGNPGDTFMGDYWFGTSGGSQWRTMDPFRRFPWYFLCRSSETTVGCGVKVRPGAFAVWQMDPGGLNLYLDLRCGTRGVILNGRTLEAAVVVSRQYSLAARAAARAFCAELSPDQILPSLPVYGCGTMAMDAASLSQDSVLKNADLLSRLADGLTNRPYQMVDCGWEKHREWGALPCGPWNSGNERFPDMSGLAASLHNIGIRPGISLRLLCDSNSALPEEWHLQRDSRFLDPSMPGVLEHIRADVARMSEWGYELIKHISTTTDCLGAEWRPRHDGPAWSFYDRSRTTAEILTDLYRTIRGARGDALIMAEDVIGHLGAGLMHIARVSRDPEDAVSWEEIQQSRVNALAFRLGQNGTFFSIDTGELPVTAATPWKDVKNLAKLLSVSGASMFLTFQRNSLSPAAMRELSNLFYNASLGDSTLYPTDWLSNTCPEVWDANGTQLAFKWFN